MCNHRNSADVALKVHIFIEKCAAVAISTSQLTFAPTSFCVILFSLSDWKNEIMFRDVSQAQFSSTTFYFALGAGWLFMLTHCTNQFCRCAIILYL